MLYVQQSLSPDEKIVHIGSFHWAYKAAGVSWLLFGFVIAYLIIHVALYMDVTAIINQRFPTLPENLKDQAWDRIIQAKGGIFSAIFDLHVAVKAVAFAAILFGVFMCVRIFITIIVTEIAVTNTRLIFKTGLIARYVGEISVDRIEGVNVIQSILGRLLGYGRVIVRGMGVGEVVLPPIENPILFRRAIEKAKTL